jgi:hypothetical protein
LDTHAAHGDSCTHGFAVQATGPGPEAKEEHMRTSLVAAAVLAVAAPLQAQDSFDTRSNRQGTTLSLTMSSGDWLVAGGYSQEMYGMELDRGALGVRFIYGHVMSAGDYFGAMTGGAELAIPVFSLPVNFTIGAQYSQAEVGDDMRIRQVGAPIHLSTSTVLVFDSFWVHPVVAFGGFAHRTEMGETQSGLKRYAAAGMELGFGAMSVRGNLQHHNSAPQQANVSLRLRF